MRSGLDEDKMRLRLEVLERVRALVPRVRDAAAEAEDARQLSAAMARAFLDAGVARILLPVELGGYGLDLSTWLDVVMEVASADASHGWCLSLMIHHPHYLCQFPAAAQRDVWANGLDVAIAASVAPKADVVGVSDGYVLSGHCAFASGVTHSDWIMVGGMAAKDESREWMLFLLPTACCRIVDTWHTVGMSGTGSHAVILEDVHVPATHAVRVADLRDGTAPGGKLYSETIYRAPLVSYSPLAFIAPMLGAARGAYDAFRDGASDHAGRSGEVPSGADIELARSAADLDAAELLMRRSAAVAQEAAPILPEIRARTMRDTARAAEYIVAALDRLMILGGTAGYARTNPVQRAWRDIHFASMHSAVSAQRGLSHFGRAELGLPRSPRQQLY